MKTKQELIEELRVEIVGNNKDMSPEEVARIANTHAEAIIASRSAKPAATPRRTGRAPIVHGRKW